VPKEDCGRFTPTGRGDGNTYALFAELFASLARPRGRAGVIVPTGIATDATMAPFFASLVNGNRLVQLVDFENRERLFPAIDSRIKFSLLTIGHDVASATFGFSSPTRLSSMIPSAVLHCQQRKSPGSTQTQKRRPSFAPAPTVY
jgi:hypothetical protein